MTQAVCKKYGEQVIPLIMDLLDPAQCAGLMPQILEKAGQLDIFHANAGLLSDTVGTGLRFIKAG